MSKPGLVRLGESNELLQVIYRQVVPRDEDESLIRNECHWGEIFNRVVERFPIEPLALRKSANVADDKLIALQTSLCDAICARGAAGAADILNHDRLVKLIAQAMRQYPCN